MITFKPSRLIFLDAGVPGAFENTENSMSSQPGDADMSVDPDYVAKMQQAQEKRGEREFRELGERLVILDNDMKDTDKKNNPTEYGMLSDSLLEIGENLMKQFNIKVDNDRSTLCWVDIETKNIHVFGIERIYEEGNKQPTKIIKKDVVIRPGWQVEHSEEEVDYNPEDMKYLIRL